MIEDEQFSEFSESHLLPFMFHVCHGAKYFSDIPVSFNFLVIGIDSFDKNILKIL